MRWLKPHYLMLIFIQSQTKFFSGIGFLRKTCQHFTIYNQPQSVNVTFKHAGLSALMKVLLSSPTSQDEKCYLKILILYNDYFLYIIFVIKTHILKTITISSQLRSPGHQGQARPRTQSGTGLWYGSHYSPMRLEEGSR